MFAVIYFYEAIIYLVFLFKLGVLKAKEKNLVRFDSLLFTSFSRRKIQEEANKTEDRCQYIKPSKYSWRMLIQVLSPNHGLRNSVSENTFCKVVF